MKKLLGKHYCNYHLDQETELCPAFPSFFELFFAFPAPKDMPGSPYTSFDWKKKWYLQTEIWVTIVVHHYWSIIVCLLSQRR